jgi:hypothetical protein
LPRTSETEQDENVDSIRHHSLFTPRDFDVSSYFAVIKPTLEKEFDYRRLTWKENCLKERLRED